jgi:2-hydroxychromene-2-carboxylate isomerase
MPGSVRFHFDYVSPYAYLAWTQIHSLAERNGRGVEPVPVLFAGLLNALGHRGPAEIPPKRIYIYKDVVRTAHVLGVPLVPPPAHPFNPLLPLRVSSLTMDPATRRRLVDGLYRASWGGGGGVESPDAVARIATEAGLDGDRAIREAQAPPAKARLKEATDAAAGAGAFGVPTMIADGELFWGFDSFGHLERFLQGKDPVDSKTVERWRDLPSSASRI